ncbi:MAG: MBL fold metallo-hydrolase [Gemmatimonadota bacterium]|nr:MBL fold metallo-hydrolase [Gemmatimonadota bacterium]
MLIECFTGGAFAENAYLLTCPASGRAVIVDPGGGVDELLARVRQKDLSVDAILLTHAHIDHVDGVAAAKEETGAPIHLHREAESQYRGVVSQARMFGLDMSGLPPVDEYLMEGETLRFGECELTVRYAPGHAPGHVIFVGDGVAVSGDCIFSGSIGRTDLPGGDFQTLMRSIREQILTLPDGMVLYTGHGPETTVGHERAFNPFLVPQYGGSRFA